MHFVFIYPAPGILGGIETLVKRMSQWLADRGHTTTLLVDRADNWADDLPRGVRCIALGERFPQLYYYYHAKKLWESFGLPRPDVIKSFDFSSSWMASVLADVTGGSAKVLAGIYNPYVFNWYYSRKNRPPWHSSRLFLHNYLKYIPQNARVFCGTDQLEELEAEYGESGVLLPIPIDASQFAAASRRPKWGKLVSVGRLSPMKEYNLYMIDVVRELRARGHDVTWTVYGTGEYEPKMREKIQRHGLEKFISLEGTVPYAKFWQVLEDAYVFVGMGTALLEAALFQVPNVAAGAFEREGRTYGPVYRQPRGSISPRLSAPLDRNVTDEIERILRLNEQQYRAESDLVYDHARVHEIDNSMNSLLDIAAKAHPIRFSRSTYLANYPMWVVRRAMKLVFGEPELGHPPAPILHPPKPDGSQRSHPAGIIPAMSA